MIFEERYKELNKQQKRAVDTIDGPLLVIAGPGSGKTEILFDMLIYGRVQGVIMFTQVGDYLMRTPRYQGKFEKIPTQIVSKPYYLMLSHQLYANYPTLANQIWAGIAEVREATTYKKVEEEAISAGH